MTEFLKGDDRVYYYVERADPKGSKKGNGVITAVAVKRVIESDNCPPHH